MADQKPRPTDRQAASEKPATTPLSSRIALWLKVYKWPLAGAFGASLVIAVGSYVYLIRDARLEPAAQLAQALARIDNPETAESIVEARRIASELDALKYRDPNFLGAIPYILGIVDFQQARRQHDRDRIESYRSAVKHLEQAERGLDPRYRVASDFALGISRSAIGDAVKAEQPLLRIVETSLMDGVSSPSPEFFEAAAALQESYLDRRRPEHLKKAIDLNDVVLRKASLEPAERDRTLLRRAQILIALHDVEQARAALSGVSKEAATKRDAVVIRAQVSIAERRFNEARAALEPVAAEGGLDSLYPRQALFLLGVSYEAEMAFENALRKYADAFRRYPDTPEGLAANVRRAELLRRAQRWEEALDAYVKSLEMIRGTGSSNRWLRIDEFRAMVTAAWDALINIQAYEFAAELARHMRPVFPANEAYEALQRVATANQLWASRLDAEVAGRPYRIREERQVELCERWRESGAAHAELAEALHESPKYADVLWISAEHFRRAHDFQDALVQITRFVNSQPRQRLPLAYVRRGEILMDLGRHDEALDHFDRVLTQFPMDIAAFPAMYLMGACEVERNHPQRAVGIWQQVLQQSRLEPSASEWQASLFALGRLQYQLAITTKSAPDPQLPDAPPIRPPTAFECLDESIRRLEEYAARYPKAADGPEARFLLSKALRERADLPRHRLARAETDNARKELQVEIQRYLTEARTQLETLVAMLQAKESAGLLDPLGQRMLRDACFERAHNLYALERYDHAIEAYGNAANRYPEDPNVLLAYIQMANCYERLGKSIDARGAAIQAMLIHKNMPDKAFTADKSLMNRADWKTWLEWARSLRESPRRDAPATAAAARPPSA